MLERNAWIFRASLFGETKFPTLLGLKTNGVQQGAAVNAPPVLFFKGAARCGSTEQQCICSTNPKKHNKKKINGFCAIKTKCRQSLHFVFMAQRMNLLSV
jgi:hypothetical protein